MRDSHQPLIFVVFILSRILDTHVAIQKHLSSPFALSKRAKRFHRPSTSQTLFSSVPQTTKEKNEQKTMHRFLESSIDFARSQSSDPPKSGDDDVLLVVALGEKHPTKKKAFVSPATIQTLTMKKKESSSSGHFAQSSWIRTLFLAVAFVCFALFYEETLAVRKTLRAQMTTFGVRGGLRRGANISPPSSSPPPPSPPPPISSSTSSLRRHFVSGEDRDGFFYRFFEKNFQDVEKFENEKLSRERMRAAVRRDSRKLALYALRRNINNPGKSVFEWVRLEGQTQWWSTNGFHEFMRDKVTEIGQKYLQDDFKEMWFLINCFDEPLMMGECPKQQQLSNLHGLIQRRTSPFSFSGDGVVVWSMAKVDGCHDDLLFPLSLIHI